jgi:hypothetical protein
MHYTTVISLMCLGITAVLCTWGVFSRHFQDNLGQCVGLSLVAIACYLGIPLKFEETSTRPEALFVQMGLCVFAVSTAWKLWGLNRKYHNRRQVPRPA